MNNQDMKDTFIHPAIDLFSTDTTTNQAGTYYLSTSTTTVTDSTRSKWFKYTVFIDTRADTSLYTAGSIPETLDQPKNYSSYYLQRNDGVDNSIYPASKN